MMMSCSAIHPGIPSLVKPFCPCFCWVLRNVISFFLDLSVFFGQGRLIHHQPSTELHFHIFFFLFLNWAAAVLCLSCWMWARDCPHECLVDFHCFSCWVLFCFLQFDSIILRLISPLCLIGGWSTGSFKREGVRRMCCVALYAGNYGILINK